MVFPTCREAVSGFVPAVCSSSSSLRRGSSSLSQRKVSSSLSLRRVAGVDLLNFPIDAG